MFINILRPPYTVQHCCTQHVAWNRQALYSMQHVACNTFLNHTPCNMLHTTCCMQQCCTMYGHQRELFINCQSIIVKAFKFSKLLTKIIKIISCSLNIYSLVLLNLH